MRAMKCCPACGKIPEGSFKIFRCNDCGSVFCGSCGRWTSRTTFACPADEDHHRDTAIGFIKNISN